MNDEICTDPDCTEAVRMLHAYIDGELPDDELGAMQGHLERCTPCDGARDFEEALQSVISAKCSEKIPADLRERLLAMCSEQAGLE
jgi:mycothiol system anti-sigma-R factor